MIQISDEVNLIEELNCKLNESLLVHLKFEELKIALLVVYNPPRINKQNFIFELDKTLENINEIYDRIIVCGDFNINVLDKNLMTSLYLSTIQSNGFQLCCRQPTRISRNTSTCLDHFFEKKLRIQKTFVMEDHNYCDHFPIVLEFEKISKSCSSEIGFRDTSFLKLLSRTSFFLDNLSKSLATIRYQETENINSAFNRFDNTFKEVLAMVAPYRRSSRNTIKKPNWLDKNMKNLIRKRNQSHKSWKMDRQNNQKLKKFKALRTKVEKTIKAKKNFYYEQKFSKCIGDSKQVYKLLNELKGVNIKNSNVPYIIKDGRRIDDNLDIANDLNTFLVGIGQKLQADIPNEILVNPEVNIL